MSTKRKITVVGAGYVGMSIAVLLSLRHEVVVLDIDTDRIDKINKRKSTIADSEIDKYLSTEELNIYATNNKEEAFKNSDFIIVATPTNFDPNLEYFDTNSVDRVIEYILNFNQSALIIIKSTIPIGYTDSINKKYNTNRVIFSPEFLREGKALHDNLYPSRIIVGGECERSLEFANILKKSAKQDEVQILRTKSSDAEAIKLFSNSYLAMRVAFFNELDSFVLSHDLNSKDIINGVCLDPRIGDGYNNPSFGYGGYCLPKDSKQLLSNFKDIPQTLISAIVSSNEVRKDFMAEKIILNNPSSIGIYRLVMKEGSDNFRSSAIIDIINKLKAKRIPIYIYEPYLKHNEFMGLEVVKNLNKFKEKSSIIISNRNTDLLNDVSGKVFSRDIFNTD